MCSTKKISVFNVKALSISLLLALTVFHNHTLFAQNFNLGIYGYDAPGPVRFFNANEQQLIYNIHATYITGMEESSQDSIIAFYGRQPEAKKAGLEHDPTYNLGAGPYYPITGSHQQDETNTILWAYISRNDSTTDIQNTLIERFIHNADSLYNHPYNPGLGEIRVAHQGWMDSTSHWSYIKYACDRIQHYFGDNVSSSVCHNIFHWARSSLSNFFSNMGNSLDIYHHEQYPFYVFHVADPMSPDSCARLAGWRFQDWHIDSLLIGSYQQTRQALLSSGNTHTKLEVIIQTQRGWLPDSGGTFYRRPTEAEVWLQAFLALSRGYKGVHSYVYRTRQSWNEWGLVTENTPRQPITDDLPDTYNHDPYHVVAQLYDHLSALGDDIQRLTVLDAYTWNGTTRHKYIKRIDGEALEENHRTIEVSLMDHPSNSYEYFMLINRRCNRDSSGFWVNAYPQNISVTLADSIPTGAYQIRDLYSNELYVTSDNTFRDIEILAGRGRIFELRRIFIQNETWANTINVSSNINVPTGKILTIAANSTVKFYSGKELKINGTLNAEGVKFTSAADGIHPGYWSKIFFDNANNSSFIRSSTIENAVYGVHCDSSSPTIGAINKPNTIQYNSGNGIKCKYASPTINYNMIEHNGIGIYCEQQSHPYINDNYITDNYSYGIFCTQTCNPYIRHNAVSDNSYGGIACLNSSSPQLIGKGR